MPIQLIQKFSPKVSKMCPLNRGFPLNIGVHCVCILKEKVFLRNDLQKQDSHYSLSLNCCQLLALFNRNVSQPLLSSP